IAGYELNGATQEDMLFARFNSNGTLDGTFGSGGSNVLNIANQERAEGVALQPDGKIVAAGYTHDSTNRDVAVVRLTTFGTRDPTFDSDGVVTTDFGGFDQAFDVIVDDGRIVIGGGGATTGSGDDFITARYLLDGELDPVFGSGGKQVTPVL